jgi:hypothetical protein
MTGKIIQSGKGASIRGWKICLRSDRVVIPPSRAAKEIDLLRSRQTQRGELS